MPVTYPLPLSILLKTSFMVSWLDYYSSLICIVRSVYLLPITVIDFILKLKEGKVTMFVDPAQMFWEVSLPFEKCWLI